MAGKNYNDIQLAARVRTMALEEVEKVLRKRKGKFYEAVLIRLAGTLLPRLNVINGDDEGGPVLIQLSGTIAKKNGLNAVTE